MKVNFSIFVNLLFGSFFEIAIFYQNSHHFHNHRNGYSKNITPPTQLPRSCHTPTIQFLSYALTWQTISATIAIMDSPATPIAHLALTDAATYRQFLLDPHTLTPSREGDACMKPTARLKTLMEQSVDTPHGRMGALDAVLATMLERALKGERWAIEKIYNELEHDGVHKVQSLNLHADFREDFNSILADIGIHDQYMTTTATDITPKTIPETPERLTDERNDTDHLTKAQDWENAFVEALRASE